PAERNAMEPKRRRKMKLPFGTSTTLSDQEAQGAEMVLCFVETVRAPSNSQLINKISQTEHAPSLQAKLYVMSCGQKSIKIKSNRSNRIFCPICCYLPDFSRSDFLKVQCFFGTSAIAQ
ncbi:MAG: hypothetical protein J6W49_05935, partial [Paludibacteraceae bacterium]|nr:hypothetical protein [Paludibacteraceae bacterium]